VPIAIISLVVLLGLVAVAFVVGWAVHLARQRTWRYPTIYQAFVGFVTDFLDTLGIGSFATTTALYRLRRAVADERIPGTLNVGHTVPTVVQALLFISIIQVEPRTLCLLIGASVLGAWLGAGVVTRLPRRKIQLGMGVALLAAAALLLGGLLDVMPKGGEALELSGPRLAIALAGNLVFGALMTIGVGAYAPIMIMVYLLGMNPKAAFPVMMGSCAFLMPAASYRFVRSGKYDAGAAIGLTLGGIGAVFLAAPIVEGLNLDAVRWLVLVVVVYTAASMLWSATKGEKHEEGKGHP
jgi:uncharacterized membrane protein YfcA